MISRFIHVAISGIISHFFMTEFISVAQSCPTPCDLKDCSRPGLAVHQQLPVYPNSCPLSQWCHPTISSSVAPFQPSIFPSIRVFSNDLALCIRKPKYWSFSFSISPSNEYSELISFRIDSFDLFVVQGILKRFLQQCSSKVSILSQWRGPGFNP